MCSLNKFMDKKMEKKVVILLVEDNRMDIELTLDAFNEVKLNNEIKIVTTGEEALSYLMGEKDYKDRTKYPLPHIILLDLKLPGISGIEVLKRIKSTPIIKRIPVVVLTSSKDEGDLILSYDYGANSYLVKPISFNEFIKVIKTLGDYWLSLNVVVPI